MPTSFRGESMARSAQSFVRFNKARPSRSPARRDISSARYDICLLSLKYASLFLRLTLFVLNGTNLRAESRTSATGPSLRSNIRTAFVKIAGIALSLAKPNIRAACEVENSPSPRFKCDTHSRAWSAKSSRVALNIDSASLFFRDEIAAASCDSGPWRISNFLEY